MTFFSDIDPVFEEETAKLIAKLTLDDLAHVLPADCFPLEEEMVRKLQIKEYNEWFSIAQDPAKLAKNGDAPVTDTAYLDVFNTAEEAAKEDRIATEPLSRSEALPSLKSCLTRSEDPAMDPVMDATSSHHAELDIVENGSLEEAIDDEWTHAASSNAGPSAKKRVNCLNCGDSYRDHEALNTPCGHYYCGDCLVALVEAFTRDESLFPLRCCQGDPISIEEVLPNLPLKLRTLFQQKHAEFSIPPKNRLYCSNYTCSTFLGSSEVLVSKIECPSCLVDTCPQCRELAHPGEGCEVNASDKALQELAKSRQWQTCPGCHAVVALSIGCYHMTCRCKTQFCYLCAALWKTCACVRWDERRLAEQ